MDFIKEFSQIGKGDAASAGGKGASLGEMTQAGIPVPQGFVILASAFEQFLEETDLNAEIDAVLHTVNPEQMHTVEKASAKIQGLILEAKMPDDIAQAIRDFYKKLDAAYVAVRSSATAEDSASAAWAGQLDSYLNTTSETLLKNVQKCWASLFTPRAIFYRYEKELHKTKISVAVVVQKMVQSEVSGIAFSVHPVTEDYNQLIIEGGFGLGEAIVSGQVTPDSYVIEKTPRRIIEKNITYQSRALWRAENGGNEWRELSEEEGNKPALSDDQALELAEIILRIESHYGFPCDIEWAFEAGHFFITQSRPITTLAPRVDKTNEGKDIATNPLTHLKREDFTYTFESSGTNLLFEDMVDSYYMAPAGESVSIWHGSKRTFTSNKDMVRCREEGLRRTIVETKRCIDDLTKVIDSVVAHLPTLRSTVEITKKDVENFFVQFRLMCKLYLYFDAAYWDGVYEQSKTNRAVAEHVALVQSFKNVVRNQFEPIFFEKDGYLPTLIQKLGTQYGVPAEEIEMYREHEILGLFEDRRVAKEEIANRRRTYAFYVTSAGEIHYVSGDSAEEFRNSFDRETHTTQTELKGLNAHSTGKKVMARVRIIRRNYGDHADTQRQMDAMTEGEVLVSETTEPELMPAFKKASAVVTDVGGLLSHAAITSREMNLPCVVGTGNASKVLKTGDLVEVDADNGVVRILNNKRPLTLFGYRDFTMAVQEVGLDAESLPLLHLDGVEQQRPYFVALRENNKDAMFLDMAQVEWQKKQILSRIEADKNYSEKLLKKSEEVCLPLMSLLNKPKALSRKELETFTEDLRVGWRWYAGVWWAIEGMEQKGIHSELLEKCMAFRKLTENFCPGADSVMRETIKALYPALKKYVEVILATEVIEDAIPPKGELEKRVERCLLVDRQMYVDKDIEKILEQSNIELLTPRPMGTESSLEGQTAYKGKYTGRVSIVFTKKDANAFAKGDVLVASSSTPDFLPAIKKAGAIVADEGGVMSHSSISSREFKIPCVIGTKFATQVLHDGDLVEVDANRGIVRIVEKSNA